MQILFAGWLLIMMTVPFHALISTWGGTTIGPIELWKVWKDVLLVVLVLLAVAQAFLDPKMFKTLWSSWITKLIFAYGALHLLSVIVVGNEVRPLLYGLAINLRLVSFLLISEGVFYYLGYRKRLLAAVILLPAVAVVIFGLLQMFVLPHDAMKWFGYQANVTIAPFNTIDQQLDQLRYMSTLRGPNPLGAYLILPGVMALAAIVFHGFKRRRPEQDAWALPVALVSSVAGATVLYGSHSRSAWIGFFVACALYVWFVVSAKLRKWLVLLGAGSLLVAGALFIQFRNTSFVQNTILHDNPDIGPSVTSNSGHSDAAKQAAKDIAERPVLGCGPGCAGPASFYDQDGAKLAENYYLQVGQEVGVVGMLLFTAIVGLVGGEFYKARNYTEALILFCSLVGLSIANLLLHVWADDSLAYVWWGAAGAILVRLQMSSNSELTPSFKL